MMVAPESVRYARSGDARIAYRVIGDGFLDPWTSASSAGRPHLDLLSEEPVWAGRGERIVSFARVVSFDRRGTGLSDPLDHPMALEQQMDDLDAVLEAAGIERGRPVGRRRGRQECDGTPQPIRIG